jgi:hypothetical protein
MTDLELVGVLTGTVQSFIARQQGSEIVMERQGSAPLPSRWIFSEITPDSFHWRSAVSHDQGKSWDAEQTMVARRRPAPTP